jgi:hypothetical protein
MAIHEVTGGFVITADRIWLPGCYESRAAAHYAFRFCCDFQAALQNEANASNNGIITHDAMRQMAKTRGYSCGQGAHARVSSDDTKENYDG